jgi:hypothetical protein
MPRIEVRFGNEISEPIKDIFRENLSQVVCDSLVVSETGEPLITLKDITLEVLSFNPEEASPLLEILIFVEPLPPSLDSRARFMPEACHEKVNHLICIATMEAGSMLMGSVEIRLSSTAKWRKVGAWTVGILLITPFFLRYPREVATTLLLLLALSMVWWFVFKVPSFISKFVCHLLSNKEVDNKR